MTHRQRQVDTDQMPDMTPDGLRLGNPGAREIGQYVYDFDSASKFLGDKPERKLAPNTKVFYMPQSRYYGNETIAVKFHQTIIVQYMQGGIIELNTGGHRTVTTKQRINQLLPPGFRVEQRDYEWLLHTPSGTHGFADSMKVSTVSGNVKYHEAGRVTPQVPALPGMTPLGMRPKGQGHASNPGNGFMERQVFQHQGYELELESGESLHTPELTKKAAMAIAEGLRYSRKVDSDFGVVVGINKIANRDSWWGRYSAPGYLDATDWVVGDTEAEVIEELERLYGDDDE